MQRIMLDAEQCRQHAVDGTPFPVSKEVAHYLRDVMRLKKDEPLWIADGLGFEGRAVIDSVSKDQVTLCIDPLTWRVSEREASIEITVGQGIPKGEKFEWVIQKCTESGVVAVWPLVTARAVVVIDSKKESRKIERWTKIAAEAAEQSHRAIVPKIGVPIGIKELIKRFNTFDLVLVAAELIGHHDTSQDQGIKSVLQRWKQKSDLDSMTRKIRFLVLVGPEGGWSDDEVALLTSAGAQAIGLGRRILRTETAAIIASTAILYEFGEYGG